MKLFMRYWFSILSISALVVVFTLEDYSPMVIGNVDIDKPLIKQATNVVRLTQEDGLGGGTGFVIKVNNKNYIISNEHVCGKNSKMKVETIEGDYGLYKVLYLAYEYDLCVLESPTRISGLTVSNQPLSYLDEISVMGSPALEITQPAFGYNLVKHLADIPIGIPSDFENAECPVKSSKKSIMTFFGPMDMCVRTYELISTTLRVYPGNSGSPVFNKQGEVVGVINSIRPPTFYGNYIPLKNLKKVIKEIERF